MLFNVAFLSLQCDCPPDFTGDRCEIPVISCSKNHCNDNGKCNESTNTCTCHPGYQGRYCESCEVLTCEHGAICKLDQKYKPMCRCPKGYSGYRCEKSICDNYCTNKGKCKVKNGLPECSCLSGYKGQKCDEDMCDQVKCMNGGVCEPTQYGHKCRCQGPFVGARCEYNLCECQKCSKADPKCQCPPNVNNPEEYCAAGNSSLSSRCKQNYCKHSGICLSIDDKPYCR